MTLGAQGKIIDFSYFKTIQGGKKSKNCHWGRGQGFLKALLKINLNFDMYDIFIIPEILERETQDKSLFPVALEHQLYGTHCC